MDLRAAPNLIHLSQSGRRSLQLEVAKGYRIVAVSGEVWVTQAGFIEDYVLRPGDGLTLESRGPAIATSFGRADIEVIEPLAAAAEGDVQPISLEVLERAQREAHRLRAEAMHQAVSAVSAWAGRLGRRLVSVLAGRGSGVRQHC